MCRDETRREEYRTYLLCLWRNARSGQGVWRASLENVRSEEVEYFASVEELVDSLRRLVSGDPATENDE